MSKSESGLLTLSGEPFATGASELIAEMGDHLDLDVVVFITPDWQGPSFIGYSGVLDRLRFAVDPPTNRFYFGRLP